ncbi:hypothetical protein ACFPRL_01945 [Pseudoclavibacter helvolus]
MTGLFGHWGPGAPSHRVRGNGLRGEPVQHRQPSPMEGHRGD